MKKLISAALLLMVFLSPAVAAAKRHDHHPHKSTHHPVGHHPHRKA
jgi:hypothetical protein